MTHEPTPIGTDDPAVSRDDPPVTRDDPPVRPRPVTPGTRPAVRPSQPPDRRPASLPPPAPPAEADDALVSRWTWVEVFGFGMGVGALAMLALLLFITCLREGSWHEHENKLRDELKQTAAKLAAAEAKAGKP